MIKPGKFYEDLTKQSKTKICDYFEKKNGGKALLIFSHGLGDLIEFLALFNTIKIWYPKWDIKLGYHPSFGFEGLHKDIIPIKTLNKMFVIPYGHSLVQINACFAPFDILDLDKNYDYVFGVQFYDYRDRKNPINNINIRQKIDMCKVLEFGMDEKDELIPYQIPIPEGIIKDEKKVLYHYNGNTDKSLKTPSLEEQEIIWNEIIEAGFNPFDCHINNFVDTVGAKQKLPPFIPEDRSLRNTASTLQDLIKHVYSSKYFVGITSGPLHLASKIIGGQNCICTEKFFKVKDYYSEYKTINVIDGDNYQKGMISKILLNNIL